MASRFIVRAAAVLRKAQKYLSDCSDDIIQDIVDHLVLASANIACHCEGVIGHIYKYLQYALRLALPRHGKLSCRIWAANSVALSPISYLRKLLNPLLRASGEDKTFPVEDIHRIDSFEKSGVPSAARTIA